MKHVSTSFMGKCKKIIRNIFPAHPHTPDGSDLAMVALAATAQYGGEISSVNVAFPNIGRLVTLRSERGQFIAQVKENGKSISTTRCPKSDPEFVEWISRILGTSALISGANATLQEAHNRKSSPELN
jgi:hypothetical protein